ncbi:MAG TPA: outer membrane beta-barrel protein [Kofleriaceae bacterium]|nr:outer membrane beta-barrel protein [Kofleriaceae bacterium]
MHARLLAVSLAPLFVASITSVAQAQAHGDVVADDAAADDASPAPAMVAVPAEVAAPAVVVAAPVVVAPAMVAPVAVMPAASCGGLGLRAARRESVMDNRWSVGLSLGSMSLTPDGSDSKTSFGVGELALRFRATPHLELEATAGGGREQLDNGDQGDLEVNTFGLALRYRFNPEGKWNWFVMGGLGEASVTLHDATQQERDDATHAMAMLGIGVERRFHHFALQAELRGVGISDKSNSDAMSAPVATPAMSVSGTTSAASVKQSGGSFTFGASYYF